MGVASLILGLIALLLAIFGGVYSWLGILVGILGIVIAAVARKNGTQGMATAGLVLSIIATVLSLVFWLACAACAAGIASAAGLI